MISTTELETLLSTLHTSEERYRNLVELTSDWVWESDPNGIYTYCSSKCIDLFGYQTEELIGKTAFYLMPPEEALRVEVLFQNIFLAQCSFNQLEHINLHKEGHLVIMETSGSPFFDEQGELLRYRGIGRDISAQVTAEKALRRSEKKLETTLNSIGDAVIATDSQQRITRMNPVAENITEWTLSEALGQPINKILKFCHTETAKAINIPVAKVLKNNKVIHLCNSCSLITRNGLLKQITASVAPLIDESKGVILVFHNITEQYKVQRELVESNQKFSAFTSAMPDIGFVLDEQGTYIDVYGAEQQPLVQDAKKLLHQNIMDILPSPLALQFISTIQTTCHTNKPQTLEYELELTQGKYYFEGRTVPMQHKPGELQRVIWIARDISTAKRTLKALQTSEQRFRQIFEKMPNIAVQGYNHAREVIFWNKTSEAIYGYTKEEVIGKKLEDLIIPSELKDRVITATDNLLHYNSDIPAGELRLQRKDGSHIPVYSSHIKLGTTDESAEMFCIDIDLTDVKKANEAIERLAYYDPLTSLPNRCLFLERLDQEQKISKRQLTFSAILFLDLDNFKYLNDSLGHSIGDLLLVEVGQRMKSLLREEDTVARLGGDEFVILLKELSCKKNTAIKQTQDIAEKVIRTLAKPINVQQHRHIITASIGITLFSGDFETADT